MGEYLEPSIKEAIELLEAQGKPFTAFVVKAVALERNTLRERLWRLEEIINEDKP